MSRLEYKNWFFLMKSRLARYAFRVTKFTTINTL